MVPVLALKGKQELSKTAREAYLEQKVAKLTDAQLEKTIVALGLAGMVKPFVLDEARKRIRDGRLETRKLSKETEVRDIVDPQKAISLLEIAGISKTEQTLKYVTLPLGQLEEDYREANPGMTWDQARDKINRVLASVIEKRTQSAKVLRK
jgi:hypothetical protein